MGEEMLYIAICEDELSMGSYLEDIICKHAQRAGVEIDIEVFLTAEECLKYIEENQSLDLLFLDIELEKMNGIELASIVREKLENNYMQIVYISAKESYAMELFETQPLNFLVKPIDEEKLFKVFSKAVKILSDKEKVFYYKKGHKQKKEFIKDILYFEVRNREIMICSRNQKDNFYETMKSLEEKLGKYGFFLCHKSFLAHYEKVKIFERDRLIMENGDIIPISRTHRETVKEIQLKREARNL